MKVNHYLVRVPVEVDGRRRWTSFAVEVRDSTNVWPRARELARLRVGEHLWDDAVVVASR